MNFIDTRFLVITLSLACAATGSAELAEAKRGLPGTEDGSACAW